MGRLIDADRLQKQFDKKSTNPNYRVNMHNIKSIISHVPTVEAIPKDQYENRLKADLKAILVELQLEIEELDSRAGYDGNGIPTFSTDYIRKKKVNELIQQKINELKGANNEQALDR